MHRLKKIFTITMLTSSLIALACDDNYKQESERKKREQQYAFEREQAQKTTAIWAGVIGAVAGTALGYLIASSDVTPEFKYYSVEKNNCYQYEPQSAKDRQIQRQLDNLAKYGQSFNFNDDYCVGIFSATPEQNIIANLRKLGIRLDQIDAHFYNKLAQDNKILSDVGYSIWWNNLKNIEHQKDIYLSNSNKIIAYFTRHEDFIRGCQIINFYNTLPLNAYDLQAWIRAQYPYDKQYPLSTFKDKIEADKQQLMRLQRYSGQYIIERSHTTQRILNHVINILYNSYAYQQEVDQKRQNELLVAYNRIEEERLNIARKQARAYDEVNRLAAEINRIERERNQNYRDNR
jgi:hypothetical protein